MEIVAQITNMAALLVFPSSANNFTPFRLPTRSVKHFTDKYTVKQNRNLL
jgi:hypothetical protein